MLEVAIQSSAGKPRERRSGRGGGKGSKARFERFKQSKAGRCQQAGSVLTFPRTWCDEVMSVGPTNCLVTTAITTFWMGYRVLGDATQRTTAITAVLVVLCYCGEGGGTTVASSIIVQCR